MYSWIRFPTNKVVRYFIRVLSLHVALCLVNNIQVVVGHVVERKPQTTNREGTRELPNYTHIILTSFPNSP